MYVIYAYLFGGERVVFISLRTSGLWFVALPIALRPDVLRTILQIPQRACPVMRVPRWWKVGWRRLVDWKLIDHPKYLDTSMA